MFFSGPMLGFCQGLRKFSVYRRSMVKNATGRVELGEALYLGDISGIFGKSSCSELERWKQLSHPVSHVILLPGVPEFSLEVGDILRLGERDFFLNAVPCDIGDLGHWTQLYCEERGDLS